MSAPEFGSVQPVPGIEIFLRIFFWISQFSFLIFGTLKSIWNQTRGCLGRLHGRSAQIFLPKTELEYIINEIKSQITAMEFDLHMQKHTAKVGRCHLLSTDWVRLSVIGLINFSSMTALLWPHWRCSLCFKYACKLL